MSEAKHQGQLVKAQQQETTFIGIKDNALLCAKQTCGFQDVVRASLNFISNFEQGVYVLILPPQGGYPNLHSFEQKIGRSLSRILNLSDI
ncbi:MAG: hypothetical protein JKY42_01095 [Flavobacteriales bacterium]|nr:hypothetical protein [Flavobacteriales bacterium]